MNAIVPAQSSNADLYRTSTDAAGLCGEIVKRTAKNIQGRKYVCVEGWQAIAVAHGCTASARDVERIDGGVRAVGEIRRMSDGAVIAEAEGFVGEDEATWFGGETTDRWGKTKALPKRPDYAIRAMAQTRAISRACRSAFAHVVVMIDGNLSTTPFEEVPDGGFDNGEVIDAPAPKSDAPKATLDERAKKLIAAISAAPDDDALAKVMANGAGLCAQLDTSDPDLLATVELARQAREAHFDGNPFAVEAA